MARQPAYSPSSGISRGVIGRTAITPRANSPTPFSRRQFLASAAATGAGLMAAGAGITHARPKVPDLNVAIIGTGAQGLVLLGDNCIKMDGLRFQAVCDLWPYHRNHAQNLLKKYGHVVRPYMDYREMLAAEKDLDAVIIATPDWMHSEMAVACLEAGRHVYCEKEMSNTLAGARAMVQAARRTGKLLQIGHQRRSNLRYLAAQDYIDRLRAVGRITYVSGQWNRWKSLNFEWKPDLALDKATLQEYGYDTMERFRNWRWYRKFSGGPIADLGSHQIDVFNWFLGGPPRAVMASGGVDYYSGRDWYDNVSTLYEWDYEWQGRKTTVRGFYDVLNTTSHGGFFETIMGDEGSINISEITPRCGIRREDLVPEAEWEHDIYRYAAKLKLIEPAALAEMEKDWSQKTRKLADQAATRSASQPAGSAASQPAGAVEEPIKIGHSLGHPGRFYPLLINPRDERPSHWWHLDNFFRACRDPKAVPLNCPAEAAYETAVSVLRVNEAVEKTCRIEFAPQEFRA